MRGFLTKHGVAMRAVDTNVVVRYLTGDDPLQAARARSAVCAGDIFVSTTVLLESEGVLRSPLGFTGREVAAVLRAFLGLQGVTVEDPVLLAEALAGAWKGMDFADALHLGAAAHCESMLTFDRRFIESARDLTVRVSEP